MPPVIGIVQARLGSRQLPGKILSPIGDRCLLDLLMARLQSARVEEWWLATSFDRSDDVTEAWGHALGMQVFRGEPDDVLSRFTAIARKRAPEWVVRIEGHTPFCDGAVVNQLLDALEEHGKGARLLETARETDLATHTTAPSAPLGYRAELIRTEALLRAESEIPDDQAWHRSNVVSWTRERAGSVTVPLPQGWPGRSHWHWSVDRFEDLAMARSAFALFGLEGTTLSYPDMVSILDHHPEVMDLNSGVTRELDDSHDIAL
jgi:spore coat polysaccharide biosynthesis protein SpsF